MARRLRLDDWMRPVRGGRYGTSEVTAKERRSMAWGLLFLVVAVPIAVRLRGLERGLVFSAGALVIGVWYVWRLWRSRHVGWRSEPRPHVPTAPTP